MKFYSTNQKVRDVSLKSAITSGLAADGGLLMPETIPTLTAQELQSLKGKDFATIARTIGYKFIQDDLPEDDFTKIVTKAFNFPLKLQSIQSQITALELFHGPTLAFKDFGARFLAGLLEYYLEKDQQKITIVVATSGDTGGAVAQAFYKSKLVDVVLLFPSKKVSELQEKQLTTLGENITALEVLGTFDDCQRMVKQALGDTELQRQRPLTSANSINIARFIPQSFYYFYAWSQYQDQTPDVFCVPSGNFGNLAAGLLAKKMGLPIKKFIAATNLNRTFPDYLTSGVFSPRPSIQTISNAMDVGNPSNFARILDLYGQDFAAITSDITPAVIDDQATAETIRRVFQETAYTLDPHGAVGYLALENYLKTSPKSSGIFLETAHPAKFKDVIDPILGTDLELPSALREAYTKESLALKISPEYSALRQILSS